MATGDPMSAKRDHILHQLEIHLAERNNEFDSLDRKSREVIGVASAVTAIIGTLSLTTSAPSPQQKLFVAVIFGVYVIAAILAYAALYPRHWETPGSTNQAEVKISLDEPDPDKYFKWIAGSYNLALEHNKRVLRGKQIFTRLAIFAIVLDVVLSVVLVFWFWFA